MSGIDKEKIQFLAKKARTFFELGEEAVRCSKLANATASDDDGPTVRSAVAMAAIPEVRDVLEDEYDLQVHLVAEPYFDMDEPPATEIEARHCLPVGYGKQSVGVRRVPSTAVDDLLWLTWRRLGLRQGAGKVRANTDRIVNGIEAGQNTPEALVDCIVDYAKMLNEGKKLPSHLRNQLLPRLFEGDGQLKLVSAEAADG